MCRWNHGDRDVVVLMRDLKDPQRLWDLVRYSRGTLHNEGLVTDDEYAELAKDHAAVARLEADDADRLKEEEQ